MAAFFVFLNRTEMQVSAWFSIGFSCLRNNSESHRLR